MAKDKSKQNSEEIGNESDSGDSVDSVSDFISMSVFILLVSFSTIYMYSNLRIKELEKRISKLESDVFFLQSPLRKEPYSSLYQKDSFEIQLIGSVASGAQK